MFGKPLPSLACKAIRGHFDRFGSNVEHRRILAEGIMPEQVCVDIHIVPIRSTFVFG